MLSLKPHLLGRVCTGMYVHTNRTMIVPQSSSVARAAHARRRSQNMTSRHNHSSRHNLHPAEPIRISLTVISRLKTKISRLDRCPMSHIPIPNYVESFRSQSVPPPNVPVTHIALSPSPSLIKNHDAQNTPFHCRGCIRY